jgi:hypothetical protein
MLLWNTGIVLSGFLVGLFGYLSAETIRQNLTTGGSALNSQLCIYLKLYLYFFVTVEAGFSLSLLELCCKYIIVAKKCQAVFGAKEDTNIVKKARVAYYIILAPLLVWLVWTLIAILVCPNDNPIEILS